MKKQTGIFEISIPTAKKIDSHFEYQINIISDCESFEKNYISIYRRYSEFLKLHNSIKSYIPSLPSFPKKAWFSNKSLPLIEQRRVGLENYMKYICVFVMNNQFENETFGIKLIEFIKENKKRIN